MEKLFGTFGCNIISCFLIAYVAVIAFVAFCSATRLLNSLYRKIKGMDISKKDVVLNMVLVPYLTALLALTASTIDWSMLAVKDQQSLITWLVLVISLFMGSFFTSLEEKLIKKFK